ncbi:glutamyl-tRNA amidotransferas-like protein [Plenodomus tracheiphilus IPT5]|uniref:Glutamyl-tRNA(Gln) amidotransferase subunit A, mitochondrial n=1 Tax=Plenodomus tracheiphilus IPT5 TaxID=1408161 RepID=A0A6A7BBU3_9PLEO|nr:glutamyl-tRNA amidotransferas-like protein [Plenodomus tracheiphilus IPT5]
MSLITRAKPYLINQTKYAHLNAFNSLYNETILKNKPQQAGPHDVKNKPIAIKDNICTKDSKTTASSAILENFTSPYDATVVKLLQDAGAVMMGKTNMDEFGMGSHSANSHFGPVKMQRYKGEEASAGGSSGGSALAVASGQCWAALGTDTGGSIRLPAAYTGVVGFKPSYGRFSRWGVIAYANSLDTVGIFGRTAKNVAAIYDILDVHDAQDPTSLPPSTRSRLGNCNRAPRQRIGIPLDYNIATLHPMVRKAWIRTLKELQSCGHSLHPVRLPSTQHALSSYYVLAPAEASSNLAKYDGVRFGSRADGIDGTPESVLFAKTRGQGFGPEVQRRILLGAFSLSAQAIDNYFIQAQKVRRLVQHDFDNVFATRNPLREQSAHLVDDPAKVDVLVCPTAPSLAPSLFEVHDQDPIQAYMNDVFTVPASLAGLPAISVPIPIDSNPENTGDSGPESIVRSAGIQVIGQFGDDTLVLDVAKLIQKRIVTPQAGHSPNMTAWGHDPSNA